MSYLKDSASIAGMDARDFKLPHVDSAPEVPEVGGTGEVGATDEAQGGSQDSGTSTPRHDFPPPLNRSLRLESPQNQMPLLSPLPACRQHPPLCKQRPLMPLTSRCS
ncbi:TPA: hypothetical protein ACH3X1_008199 [Trebouxia sp. C0004]